MPFSPAGTLFVFHFSDFFVAVGLWLMYLVYGVTLNVALDFHVTV